MLNKINFSCLLKKTTYKELNINKIDKKIKSAYNKL